MKKILHIFSSFEVGGVQRRFADLLRLQVKRDDADAYHHLIFALDGTYDAESLLPPDAPCSRADLRLPGGPLPWQLLQLRRLLKRSQAHMMVTYNWGSVAFNLANRLFPILPCLHVQDGFGREEQQQQLTRRRRLRRFAYGGKTQVAVPSQYLRQIAKNDWHIPNTHLHYIPNGIDLDRHCKAENLSLRASLGLKPNMTVIGTVAALRPEKNIDRLIEAFSQLQQPKDTYRLLIVGDGPCRDSAGQTAVRLGVDKQVIFAGYQAAPEDYIALMNIFAISSDTEQMPIAVIEAMAAGKVIAATNVGDIRHMVCDDNKPYVHGRGASDLAHSLDQLLALQETRHKIGQKNRDQALLHHRESVMFDRWTCLYNLVMGSA